MSSPEGRSDPIRRVRLTWTGRSDVFEGTAGGQPITLDSDGVEGPSPTQALLLSLAGCMAVDVRMILEKSRVPLTALEVEVAGRRAEKPPRRFLAIDLTFRLTGPTEANRKRIDRAVQLSRDRYCSVMHSLAPDIAIGIDVLLETPAGAAP
ncbi:MAG: OsmC family protein [Gemmatimonadota bacterium]